MSKKTAPSSEEIRKKILKLLTNFEQELKSSELRQKVLSLVPVFHALRDLGKSMISPDLTISARDRILHYFQKYPNTVIKGDEFLVVSGIQEYARRIRELRVQLGWAILSGKTAKEMAVEDDAPVRNADFMRMKPDDYILTSEQPDRDAAYRWAVANEIRKEKISVRDKLLKYFKSNVGKSLTGEELRYVASDKKEWARRVRELRTEFGWPIVTKNTGRPDMPVGTYILESLRQSPEHDRRIPDPIRYAVMRRDGHKCMKCGWSHDEWNPSAPRHLEIHHIKEHVKGGQNTEGNLLTVCTICHDDLHRVQKKRI